MFLARILLFFATLTAAVCAEATPAVALYYGQQAPLSDFRAFDIVVVEPDHGHDPKRYARPDSALYAYVSVAEVQASRPYYKAIPETWKMARNGDWNSVVIDQTPTEWPEFFAEQVVAPLWARGYRGFFLDTLDSYRLARKFDEAAQQAGLVRVIETLHKRFPGIQLILNRGFEIVPKVRDKIRMVAAESIFQGWNASNQRYEPVKAADREWLLTQLQTIRQRDGLDILAIDYVAPHDRALSRETAERIKALGFIPWVTDSNLESVGIGAIEAVPRRIAMIYDSAESPALNYANAHRFLQMPINHLGYIVDYVDARKPLPEQIRPDRYAGIVTWISGQLPDTQGRALSRWLLNRIDAGLRLAIIGDFGFPVEPSLASRLGLKLQSGSVSGTLGIVRQHPMLGFEAKPLPNRTGLPPIRLADKQAEALIELQDAKQQIFTGGALTRWGGFILDPFALIEVPGTEQARWVIDPFRFLQESLHLPALPAPDVTTENGRRLFFSHIDGDGFPSLAEFPGSPPAAEVLLKEILEKYRIPTTVSVIESEVSPEGLHPKQSPQLEDIARRMFRLPHVEIASHTFAHPFLWDHSVKHGIFKDGKEEYYHLNVPGYRFDLNREIVGSMNYIRQRLAPPDKPVRILLWSGDTAPGADALEITERSGFLNMNGGDTSITRSNPSLTAVGALGIQKNGYLQVYAPITNENIYTNLWRGPYYGFERVTESFEMTESPRRLKPVNIYYHTYSASKPAGVKALHRAFAWTQTQLLHPVFASEYIAKVQDFHTLAVAREAQGWRVRGDGRLRTLRLPTDMFPDMAAAQGVAGHTPGRDGNYLHLTDSSAWFASRNTPDKQPYLFDANGRISHWQKTPGPGKLRLSFQLNAHQALDFRLANVTACRIEINGKSVTPDRTETLATIPVSRFRLKDAAAKIEISCAAP
ncbi:bifunctional glycoside hydrolase 114/ polysaccharide deacetylase family protein [Dechloromonas denitrificans]|uniref:bifunctional glycoside hydrolase 114/ polysaccharide deacetylase family protein n=1 Tax=Dechloromonas denitrificans TaxID=281362 RepID=UPI001CF88035|nr:bifunctional glycoside hydrolase 114/ polysaccharide deacetylase family protein [Dechloromonas denitrificans]UCV11299.1 bifunctional glycoside hydrolase 114/ polysaccharide deacetylase family protein [Dechloromonas denitrificans]